MTVSINSVEALIFDLGGVVIDIDFNNVFSFWADCSNRSVEEIRARFSFDQNYEAHERGEIGALDYFNTLRNALGIDISDAQFEAGWNSIFNGEIPGIAGLLQKAREIFPIYAFTNSNHTHREVWSKQFAETLNLFEAIFISSEIGKRKPESAAFEIVAESIGLKFHQMLFFDDSIENVAGAKKIGIHAVRVRSLMDIEAGLRGISDFR